MTVSDPVIIPGAARANIMVARNDTVPLVFVIKHRTVDGTLSNTDITGDTWTLLIEWEDDVMRVNLNVSPPASQVAWAAPDVDRIPSDCATYKLIRQQAAGGERRTCLYGDFRVF